MVRLLALLVILCSFVSPVMAEGTTSGDFKHPGYTKDGSGTVSPVQWRETDAECKECDALAASYNKVMAGVFQLRYEIANVEATQKTVGGFLADAKFGQSMGAHKGLGDAQQEGVAMAMNAMEEYQTMQDQIPVLKAQLDNLEALSEDLRNQLDICESTQCAGGPETPRLRIGENVKVSGVLPFDWSGPYPAVCEKCAKLAARLNELPTLSRAAIAEIEIAKADIVQADAAIARYRASHTAFVAGQANPDAMDKELEKLNTEHDAGRIEDLQKQKKVAESRMRSNQQDLDEIKRNFDQTLALYNKCTPTCETGMAEPEKKDQLVINGGVRMEWDPKSCFAGVDLNESYVLGANSQYGTGAATKNKVKDMASGAAMGALGSVLGGGGSFGGGNRFEKGIGSMGTMGGHGDTDGGGGKSGPKTVTSPLKSSDWFRMTPVNGWDIGTRAGFTDDGLVIDQKIFDSPDSNSTFHISWLQDQKGRRILPTQYFIYDIYRDHKLTVWWTYDHWTDGVHDYHDEGRESTAWREDLGSFKLRFGGDKGYESSVWYQSGFDTAVKGVRQVGALFPTITADDLKGCGLNAVTQFTLPSQDPVITQPFAVNLRYGNEPDPKNPHAGLQITAPPY